MYVLRHGFVNLLPFVDLKMWEDSKLKSTVIILGVGLTLIVWLWYVNFHMPRLLADTGYIYIFGKVASLIASAVIASTISLLVFLAITNPRKLARVIRFSRARLIDSVVLWIFIPTGLFYYLPITNITVAAAFPEYVHRVFSGWNNPHATSTYEVTVSYMLVQFGLYAALFIGCCLVSSIIVSCINRRVVRLSVFKIGRAHV